MTCVNIMINIETNIYDLYQINYFKYFGIIAACVGNFVAQRKIREIQLIPQYLHQIRSEDDFFIEI